MASVAATISYIFHPSITPFTSASTTHCIPFPPISIAPTTQALPSTLNLIRRSHVLLAPIHCGGGDDGGGGNVGGRGGGGREGDGEDDDEEDEYSSERKKNIGDAAFALAQLGKTVDTIPVDLAAAIEAGRIPVSVLRRFVEMDRSKVLSWLMKFAGFKERILADDLFLAKVAMECGVGMIAKTVAEWERRRENFVKEIDFVIADVAMAIIADFMLVWLPAPTISFRLPLSVSAGPIANFFFSCPDNGFQIALGGTSYSFIQRMGSIVRNGSKLFLVGTASSLIGTGVTNALIKSRKAFDSDTDNEVEDVPIVSTSIAYGIYMAVSSNLRYQLLAGVVEQRILEPLLHEQKLLLSALCFAVRTGNTYLGSLMWVDYARLIGIQKVQEVDNSTEEVKPTAL